MIRRLPLIAAIGAVLLLTACGPAVPGAPTATPIASGVAAPTSSPAPTTAPAPTPTPSPSASTAATITAGTCTAAEMAHNEEFAIPTIYTVYNTDSTHPVTIKYTAFNSDGTLPVETITVTAPVTNIIGYSCTDASDGALWVLKASHSVIGTIGCVLDFGGMIVRTDSQGQEDPSAHINCTGNPGE